MELDTFASSIDHTVLGPATTVSDVGAVIDDALEYGMNVCIPPSHVADAATAIGADRPTAVATVIGFPNGQATISSKVQEAKQAYEDGADELDMVLNVGRLKDDDESYLKRELDAVCSATPLTTKVIICTPLLSETDTVQAAELVAESDAEYIKTATGFHGGGATVDDVSLLSEYGRVKASGGVGSYEDALAMFEAGASRIGASSGVQIVTGHPDSK